MSPAISGRLAVAFSGGPDSLGLLVVLRQILGPQGLVAAHVDHGGTAAAERRHDAETLARLCEIEFLSAQRSVDGERRPGESWEAAARRVRYRTLEELADRAACDWIATAHHLEDQAETLILRLRQGTDWMGLAGIAARRGRIVRPALAVSKWHLRAFLEDLELKPIQDPTNRLPRSARNLVRLFTIPHLLRESAIADDQFSALLARVAVAARSARQAVARRNDLAAVESPALRRFRASIAAQDALLPAPGRGALESPRRGAESSDLFTGRGGFLWSRRTLQPHRSTQRTSGTPFSYTFSAPGRVEMPHLGLALRMWRDHSQPWMFEGRADSAGFWLSGVTLSPSLEVRSRRPGDVLRPLGSNGRRKLKDLLIDRRVPADARGRLPLLVHAGKIVWVPGVTVDEDFRLQADGPCWVARLEPLDRLKEDY